MMDCLRCGTPFVRVSGSRSSHCSVVCRFWSKVSIRSGNECWPWTAFVNKGYGWFMAPGRRRVPAHRMAWELTYGPIPEGLCICHRCDNCPCCNPAHLFPGTPKDNSDDRDAKGRNINKCGEAHGMSKLTLVQAKAIHHRANNGETTVALADEYGMSQQLVSRIKLKQLWRKSL